MNHWNNGIPTLWKRTKLKDIILQKNQGVNTTTENVKYSSDGYPVIRAKNISPFNIDFNEVVYVDSQTFNKIRDDCKPKVNDVLYTNIGSQFGSAALLKKDCEFMIAWNVLKLRPNSKIVDPDYFCFLLNYKKRKIQTLNSSSTMPFVSGKSLDNLSIFLPPLLEQKQVVNFLLPIISKINLNVQINKKLEDLEGSLFRYWFVDFEFPDAEGMPHKSSGGEMVNSELGKIPVGWKIVDLSAVADVIDCLHTKKPEREKTGKILLQVFNIGENAELNLSDCYYVSEMDYDFWTHKIELKQGDLMISKTGRVGAISQIPEGLKFGIGRNLVAIRPTKILPTYTLDYLLSKHGQQEIQRLTMSGTILRSLHVKYIKKIKFLVPPELLLIQYEKMARPFRAKIENNLKENISLSQLRDSLLPKLMSGKIRVPVSKDNLGV